VETNRTTIKQKAVSLRKSGKTFRQISKQLNLALGTTHLWTKHVKLTKSQQSLIKQKHQKAFISGRKKAAELQKHKTKTTQLKYRKVGYKLINSLSKRELLLIGAALYWSEGFKKDSRLGFANSDPKMIKLFLKWLFKIGKVPKNCIRLRVGLNQHYKNKAGQIQKRWSKITNIPLSQFQKPFFQKVKWKKHYPNPESYLGVLRIRANQQTNLFYIIKGMLKGLKTAG